MAACYSKNAILKGTVDFYCLVCETYLRSEADNIDHIAKPIHKKNLDSTRYVKDFEEDFIRKIKKGYFCELCNKLFPMMARVKIHVKEPAHIDSKNVMFFKRNGVYIIAFEKVVINDKAWNGLNEESCAFCNTEYEDEEIHKSLLSHILNIIQIKVEVDENKNIYRKIDDVSFHCLTCNMVLALNNITRHFEEDQHKHLYQECCAISLNNINKNELKEKESSKVIEDQSEKSNEHLTMPLNNTGENTEQEHTPSGTDVNKKCDVVVETTAIDARPLNDICEKKKESKIAANSVVNKESEVSKVNSEECVPKPSNRTGENMEETKTVQDIDVDKSNKKLGDEKVKKNKTKTNPSELNSNKKSKISNEINKTTKSKSGYNIEEYEKQICKMLGTKDYITLDENGKTICILCDWIMDPMSQTKKIHISGLHHQTLEKMHKRRLAEIGDQNRKNNTEGETRDKNSKNNTEGETRDKNSKNNTEGETRDKNRKNNTEGETKDKNRKNNTEGETRDKNSKNNTEGETRDKNRKNNTEGETRNKNSKNNTEGETRDENRKNNTQGETRDKNNIENTVQNKSILDLVSKFQDNNVNINLLFNTAVCKKCSINLPYDVDAIEEHILKHNKETSKEENKVILQSHEANTKVTCEHFNEVTIGENRNEGNVRNENDEKLVTVEDRKEIEPTIKQAPVNTDEELTSNKASLKNETESGIIEPSVSTNLQKQSLGSYIKILTAVKHMIFNDVIINDVFCISFTSFNYFLSINGETKCLVCEEELRDIEAHINTLKHIKLLNDLPVIINEKTEFVREIHPNLLHCGFCNMAVSSWSEMLEHFKNSFHKESKDAAGWRMKLYDTEFGVENNYKTLSDTSQLSMRNMFSGFF